MTKWKTVQNRAEAGFQGAILRPAKGGAGTLGQRVSVRDESRVSHRGTRWNHFQLQLLQV